MMVPQLSEHQHTHMPQRKKAKMYTIGDWVEIWSGFTQRWMHGEVIDTVREGCTRDTVELRAGSAKVRYHGDRFKWVEPQFSEELLRPSAPKLTGFLRKQKSSGGKWCDVCVDVQKGHLTWCFDLDAAIRGEEKWGHAHLLCLQQRDNSLGRRILVPSNGRTFSVPSSSGAYDTFLASDDDEAGKWVYRLRENAEYCAEIEKLKQSTIRDELAN
jgi:hypothetical protein